MEIDPYEQLYSKLKEIDRFGSQYFKDWLKHSLGYANKREIFDLETDKKVLLKLFLECNQMTGGKQVYLNLRTSYEIYSKIINEAYNSREDIHNIYKFSKILKENFKIDKEKINNLKNPAKEIVYLLADGLKGVGRKIAALYIKFLIVDLDFFDNKDEILQKGIEMPLDIMVFLLCRDAFLFPELQGKSDYTQQNVIVYYNNRIKNYNNYWEFENLWFLGHFYYCPACRNIPKSRKWKPKKEWICRKDRIKLEIEDYFTLKEELPEICPY